MVSGIMARTLSEAFEKDLLQITGRLFAAGPEVSRPYMQPTRRMASSSFYHDEPTAKEPRLTSSGSGSGSSPHSSSSHASSKSAQALQKAKRQKEMEEMEQLIQTLQNSISRLEREISARRKGVMKEEEVATPLDTRPMTVEEKRTLSLQVSQLNEVEVEGLLNIVKGSIPEDQSQQEDIELDFNMLPNEVLRQMERYIDECKKAKMVPRRHRMKPQGGMGNGGMSHTTQSMFDYDDTHSVEDFNDSGREWEG